MGCIYVHHKGGPPGLLPLHAALSMSACPHVLLGWTHAQVQLDPMGQDGLLSGLGLPFKRPPLLHNGPALPWANRPISQEMPAPTLSRGIELWALEAAEPVGSSCGFPLPHLQAPARWSGVRPGFESCSASPFWRLSFLL